MKRLDEGDALKTGFNGRFMVVYRSAHSDDLQFKGTCGLSYGLEDIEVLAYELAEAEDWEEFRDMYAMGQNPIYDDPACIAQQLVCEDLISHWGK